MEPLVSKAMAQAAPCARRRPTPISYSSAMLHSCRVTARTFASSPQRRYPKPQGSINPYAGQDSTASYAQPAANVSQAVGKEEKNHFERIEEESRMKQVYSPWMREGSNVPPVARNRSAGAMTKGKLLTTPSRMLKFILPLTTRDKNKDRKDVEPLALLVHPQQPLSYLERLIQSELPVMEDGKPPSVQFRAEDSGEDELPEGRKSDIEEEEAEEEVQEEKLDNAEETRIDGKVERTGKINASPTAEADAALPAHGHSSPTSTSDWTSTPSRPNFVRWSPSTEIGDFIRDAARGKEFAVAIQSAEPIFVGVPSFADRTYYLRMRLRKTAKRISQLADVKKECDRLAHKGAQRVAQGGFAGLIGWWGSVYYLTFMTDLGWDVMEPVTYLVGLSGLIGGYMWFLYHNREVSYRSAMNFTVSRRQSQLYEQKGFDLAKWEMLVEEGNRLRREVKLVAEEYDVEWDETRDEGDEKVREALREERKKKKRDEKEGEDGKKTKEEKEDED